MHYRYEAQGTCAQIIEFDLEDNKVTNLEFLGGCNGNLKAIASLVEGMSPDDIANKLAGNLCGNRDTSCADQLAKALMEAKEKAS